MCIFLPVGMHVFLFHSTPVYNMYTRKICALRVQEFKFYSDEIYQIRKNKEMK